MTAQSEISGERGSKQLTPCFILVAGRCEPLSGLSAQIRHHSPPARQRKRGAAGELGGSANRDAPPDLLNRDTGNLHGSVSIVSIASISGVEGKHDHPQTRWMISTIRIDDSGSSSNSSQALQTRREGGSLR